MGYNVSSRSARADLVSKKKMKTISRQVCREGGKEAGKEEGGKRGGIC